MKTPRRPAKKIVRRVVRKGVNSRKPLAEIMTAAQAAIFDIPKPPDGFSYQWNAVTEIDSMLSEGWQRVAYRQHKELPRALNADGYIVYRGNALFQISDAVVRKDLTCLRLKAKDMEDSFYVDATLLQGRHMQIMPSSFIVSSDYERVPDGAGPAPVGVTITFMAPTRWQDAAAALKLPLGEYVRRRVVMGGHPMTPSADGTFSPTNQNEADEED